MVTLKAYAKINLTLDITGRRPDGYHNLRSVMQTIMLHDTVTLQKADGITVTVNRHDLPTDERNITYRAVTCVMQRFPDIRGAAVHLEKQIPVSAGLGGGSSDAAAVLRGMAELFGVCVHEIAPLLGADVPFLLRGGTLLAEGVGDRLTPLPAHPPVWMVLAKPIAGLSAKDVYERYSRNRMEYTPKTDDMVQALENGNIIEIGSHLSNALHDAAASECPFINELIGCMRIGAIGVNLSGSGPTVYAYHATREAAEEAAAHIQRTHDAHIEAVFVTRPHNERTTL
jgi:4-diphosphocytidyl-2-C-methyl-D-erythritol kinase